MHSKFMIKMEMDWFHLRNCDTH